MYGVLGRWSTSCPWMIRLRRTPSAFTCYLEHNCSVGSLGKGDHAMAWRLEGTYIENCNCDVVCPCGASGFSAPADYDRCTAVLAWHIDSGEVDGTDVGDISVVLVLDIRSFQAPRHSMIS